MPHVKGNKFKPKKTEEELVEEATAAATAKAALEKAAGKKRKTPAAGNKSTFIAPPTVVNPAPKGKNSSAAVATSNWAALSAVLHKPKKRRKDGNEKQNNIMSSKSNNASGAGIIDTSGGNATATRVLAIDCEMVGIGREGLRSALARVGIVNASGQVVYHSFVRPTAKVTDYRTRYSGVRAKDLKDAASFDEVRSEVLNIIKDRILVGHAIINDLEVLKIEHDKKLIRDTAHYPPFMKLREATGKLKPQALRHLAKEHLGTSIQDGEHSPIEDARTALMLYQRFKKDWEQWHGKTGGRTDTSMHHSAPKAVKSLEELAKNDYMADL